MFEGLDRPVSPVASAVNSTDTNSIAAGSSIGQRRNRLILIRGATLAPACAAPWPRASASSRLK